MFDRGGSPALIRQQVSQSQVNSRGVDLDLDGALKRGPGLCGIPLENVLVTEADEALGVAGIRLCCALEELDSAALIPLPISNFTQSDQSQWMTWEPCGGRLRRVELFLGDRRPWTGPPWRRR